LFNNSTTVSPVRGNAFGASVAALLLAAVPAAAQAPDDDPIARVEPEREPLETALDRLVDEALVANLELAGSRATAEQRLAEIDAARAKFLPALDLSVRYSRADGGRTIEVPVGDLVNPLYAQIERLGGPAFAPVSNQTIEFLRREEQDSRLSLTQSIYDARIAPGVAATRSLHESATAATAALRSRVARDVRQGYFAWLAARDALAILDDTLVLARDNLRTNASLFANGKITRDLVLRAEADVLELEQQRRGAASAVTLGTSYVNVLRRAPLDRALPEAALDADSPRRFRVELVRRLDGAPLEHEPLAERAVAARPELAELDAAIDASTAQEAVARAAFKPRVGFALEGGSQGVDYGWDDDERFVMASLVVRFSAYSGGETNARVRASRAATDALAARREQAALSVRLEVQRALEALEVADASLDAAAQRVAAADAAFTIVSRKRDLGQINQTEFLDARNASTDAQLNLNRTRADALARLAEVEYAIGLDQ
jgi:outer membrane protein TolC